MNSVPATPTPALRLRGRDALEVLHRISTQSLMDLAPGDGRATMFCDFRGRLLHRAWVAHAEAGIVWLLRADAPAADLAAFVDRSVFREDVKFDDATGAAEAPALPAAERFANELDRILSGAPRHGHEIAEEFTPFEIGRSHEVHLSKGCFTGQEALMRLMTYKSVRRRLALVAGTGAAPEVAIDVTRDEARVGRLTSATPDGAGWTGLAVLAHATAEQPEGLECGGVPITRVDAFPLTRPLGLPESTGTI